MIMHHERIGGFQRVVAEEPRREILSHIHGDAHGTVAHGDAPQIRPMGQERGEQRGRRARATRWRIAEGGEGTRKATPAIHGHQEFFNAHPRQMSLNDAAEFLHPGRDVQGIIACGTEPVVLDADKGMGGEAGHRLLRHGITRLPEVPERVLDGLGHGEFRIGLGLFLRPLRLIIDQFPEGHMPPTGREIEGASASGIPDPQGQGEFPRPSLARPVGLPQGRPPRRGDNVRRGLFREGMTHAGVQWGHQLESRL